MRGFTKIKPDQCAAIIVALVISLALGLLLSLGRAYQTQDMHALLRVGLWLIVCGLISFQVLFINALAKEWLARSQFCGRLQINLLSKTIALMTTNLLLAVELDLLKYTPLLPKQHDPYLEFVMFLAPPVLLIGLVVLFAVDFLAKSNLITQAATDGSNTEVADSAEQQVLENWPKPESIIYVQAQEHYLNIQTEQGGYFIRARMKDAADYLHHVNGLQVHRSWWVAESAMDKVVKNNRDYSILLKGGEMVPIGRSRVTKLKAKGWI